MEDQTIMSDEQARAAAILHWIGSIEEATRRLEASAYLLRSGLLSEAGRVLLESQIAVVKATAARGPDGLQAEGSAEGARLMWELPTGGRVLMQGEIEEEGGAEQ